MLTPVAALLCMEESLNRFEGTSNERGMTVKMLHVLGFSFQISDGPMPCEVGKNRLLCRVLSLIHLRWATKAFRMLERMQALFYFPKRATRRAQ